MPKFVGKLVRNATFNHLVDIGGLGTNAPTASELTSDRLTLTANIGEYIVDAQQGIGSDTADDIDGIDVSTGKEGMFLILIAATGVTLTLKDENAGAAADEDKIRLPSGTDVVFTDDEAVFLYHDDTLNRWVLISGPIAAGAHTHTNDHVAVTLAGTPDYLTISGQAITLTKLDITDDTNLIADTGITLSTNTLSIDASQTQITAVGTLSGLTLSADINLDGNNIDSGGVMFLKEQTNADADVAGSGQLWTNTDTPNTLAFTDDAGNDHEISGIKFVTFRVIASGTDVTTGTNKMGDWVCPFNGFILQDDDYKGYCSANVDTDGTTGTMVIDVNKGGTSIFTTNLLNIETGETSTITAATQPDLSTNPLSITAGDKITIDIDTIQTTAAKGLSVTLAIRQIPQV